MPTARVIDGHHAENIKDSDWQRMAAFGIWGFIHKASEGTSFGDRKYAERRKLAKKAGLRWGAYHFATGGNVEDQVDNFLRIAQPDKDTLLALDYEPHKSSTMTLAQAQRFSELVLMRTGQRPALYSGHLIKEKLTKPSDFWARHRLWLCQYGPTAKLPPSWSRYFIWQYAADGHGPQPRMVPGTSNVDADMNTVDVDRATFDRLWAPGDDPAWDSNVQIWLKTGKLPPQASGAPAAPAVVTVMPGVAPFVTDVPVIPVSVAQNATEAGSAVVPPTPGVLERVEDGLQALWDRVTHR